MNIRHGDLTLIGIKKLPEGLKAAGTLVLMRGSHGNDHTATCGMLYLKADNPEAPFGLQKLLDFGAEGVEGPMSDDRFHVGYFVAARGCQLTHIDHGEDRGAGPRVVDIEDGIYGLLGQFEDRHEGMEQVVD